jgi:Xaa-Pro aminopeptidase
MPPNRFASATRSWPTLSLHERDRRWRLVQQLIERQGLDALLVYGERDTVGQPLYAPDAWLTNDRPGNAVVVPRGEDPYLLVQLHIAVGQHMEALRRGDSTWIPPERMYAGGKGENPGSGRAARAIAAFLHDKRLDTGRIGVVGLEPAGASFPDGVMPYGTFAGLEQRCPNATFVEVGDQWHQLVMARSDEELALVGRAAEVGEAMCAAIIDTTRVGAGEHEIYAAAMQASFAAGGTSPWLILVVAHDGQSVGWGPPSWTYRAQPPSVIRDGDVVMAELFPTYGMMESQQQLSIAVGDVHPDVLRAADVSRASYQAGLSALRPGCTFGDLNNAMEKPVRAAGGWVLTPLVHTLNPHLLVGGCGLPPDLPDAAAYQTLGGFTTRGADVELQSGLTFAFQGNCMFGRRRVNIGGTVVLTEHGVHELNTLPNTLHRV